MDMFVFDIDGTLAHGDTPLTDLDKSEMNYHLEKGDAIVIASGRPVCGAKKYLSQLMESPNRFCIGSNGSDVQSFAGEHYSRTGLTYADYLYVRKLCWKPGRAVYVYIGDEVGSHDHQWMVYEEYTWNKMTKLIDFNHEPLQPTDYITKIVVYSDHEDSLALESQIKGMDFGHMRMVRSTPVFLEWINKDVDKSKGVQALAEKLHITDPLHIHTFGDSMNDFYMIKNYDGTAMGNAMDEIKKVAKRVTLPVTEDGVGVALRDVFHR